MGDKIETPITITALWLRRDGDHVVMLAEINGKWRLAAREYYDAPFSHIAEGNGAARWPTDPVTEASAAIEP